MRDQFLLILPSNSSMKYYPDNTVTHFITQLPNTLKLQGEWAVALTEIQFPRTFIHVDKTSPHVMAKAFKLKVNNNKTVLPAIKKNAIKLASKVQYKIDIPSGLYPSINALIRTINHTTVFKEHISMEYNEMRSMVSVKAVPNGCNKTICERSHIVYFSDTFSKIFGFKPDTIMDIHEQPIYTADFPASLTHAIPDKLFVYTDICESYVTGDVQTPLLRIVPVDTTNYVYGSTQTKSFSPPNYIPLLRSEFNTIDIDIRTHTGDPVPFQSGTLIVTLHFKRVR